MSRYSDTLLDHFQSPRNCRRMPDPDFVGVAGSPGQGPFLVVYLRVAAERVVEASYQCNGCGITIACGSALTELLRGRSRRECAELTSGQLQAALDGLPPDKQHRAAVAISALQDALRQWQPSLAYAGAN